MRRRVIVMAMLLLRRCGFWWPEIAVVEMVVARKIRVGKRRGEIEKQGKD